MESAKCEHDGFGTIVFQHFVIQGLWTFRCRKCNAQVGRTDAFLGDRRIGPWVFDDAPPARDHARIYDFDAG